MTRNHLLKLTLRRHVADEISVWRMTMDVIGVALGAPSSRREPRR